MIKILILTSTYLRSKNDRIFLGNFVCILTQRLSNSFKTYVLAPRDKYSKQEEIINGIKIFRHQQAPFGVCGLAYGSGIIPNLRKNKLLYFLAPFFLLYQFIYLSKIVKMEDIKIIHAHWIIPQGFVAVLYKKFIKKNIKILVTTHGADILGDEYSINSYVRDFLVQFIFKNIDELTTNSSYNKNLLRQLGYSKKIHSLPMGVDTKFFSPTNKDLRLKDKYKINGDIILYVGSIIERKGIRYLIKAIPNIISKYPNIVLLVIGEGNLKQELIDICFELKIIDNVKFLGFISEERKPEYFASADIFAFPSLSEGLGVVILEAMSSGLITVVSDLPVFNDMIIDNVTGFIVKKRSSEQLSEKIINILDNKNSFSQLKKNARSLVISNFDWDTISQKFENLLNRMI